MKHYLIVLIMIILMGCNSNPPKEYVLNEKDLVPEGITFSESKDVFYLTSIAKSKIIELNRTSGSQVDMIKENEFGYSPGVGIFADDERNLLHAIGGYYLQADSLSSLFTFDLNTKLLLKRYDITGVHFLNDLVKDKKGNIYLTDTKDASIFILTPESEQLALFFKSSEIEYPNGITISDDNTKLYIASTTKGVRVLDILTKRILNKEDTLDMSTGIDGLKFYKDHLYAIQNSSRPNPYNFRKLILNQNQDKIIDFEVIDDSHRLNVPLTFCFAGDKAVVIANSNLQYLNQKTFEFYDADSIPKTRVLIYEIE